MKWLIPFSLLIVFEVLADVFAKEWSIRKGMTFGSIALVCYLIGNAFWIFALGNGAELGRGATLFSVISAVLAVLIGVYFYHEQWSGMTWVGFVLALASIVFLFWE